MERHENLRECRYFLLPFSLKVVFCLSRFFVTPNSEKYQQKKMWFWKNIFYQNKQRVNYI